MDKEQRDRAESDPAIGESNKKKSRKILNRENLRQEIVELAKEIPFQIKKDDPGLFFVFANDEDIHTACGYEVQKPPGVMQMATAALSAQSFKNWVHHICTLVNPNCAIPLGPGLESVNAFHHLTGEELADIQGRIGFYQQWGFTCRQAGVTVGQCFAAYKSGRGSLTIALVNNLGPFLQL